MSQPYTFLNHDINLSSFTVSATVSGGIESALFFQQIQGRDATYVAAAEVGHSISFMFLVSTLHHPAPPKISKKNVSSKICKVAGNGGRGLGA